MRRLGIWRWLLRQGRRIALGRVWLRKKLGLDEPEHPHGRASIVREFHRARRLDRPPVFVVQGIRGSGKSDLLTHLRLSFERRMAWRWAEELDARLDFTTLEPEHEQALAELRRQLVNDASKLRRVRCPRFQLLRARLAQERTRAPGSGLTPSDIEADVEWFLGVGTTAASAATGMAMPRLTLRAGIGRWLRLAWPHVSPTKAARWVRDFKAELPDSTVPARTETARVRDLQRGLSKAMAEDLRQCTRRRFLRVNEIAVFVDAYDRIERSSNPYFLLDFSTHLRDVGARVLLVVACRHQRLWNRLLTSADAEDFQNFQASERVELHHLPPLAMSDRMYALHDYGVPYDLAERLAELSAGLPMALRLLGSRFGKRPVLTERERILLEELPDPGEFVDDDWVQKFGLVMGRDALAQMPQELIWHARAAACLRTFDRKSLAAILGDDFRAKLFEELVDSPLVEAPRPSPVLASDEAYRVRSFARELLLKEQDEPEAARRWHERAKTYFEECAVRVHEPELRFVVGVEELFHDLYVEGTVAEERLVATWREQLLGGRLDRCELVLAAARDSDWRNPQWRAKVLTLAGRMYLASDNYLLAEERLDSARRYVPAGDTSVLSLAISQALAKCYRMQGRVAEAHRELTRLHSKDGNPAVLDFYYAWTESLLAKFGGDLRMADELAKAAEEELQRILTSEDIAKHMSYADSLGFGPLPRKLFHCFRHRADIARRAGRYQESGALLAKAVEGYEADPEAGVLQYAGLVRAHLLRHEGDFGTAEQLAQEAVDFFASEGPRHRRGAMMALRCLAQAQLAGNEPTDAHAALTALLDADPKHYPAGRTFALYGLGELARYDGDTEGARRYYHDAFDGGDERQVRFERWYARLSTAELEREDHPDRTGPILRELIARPEVFSHPAVRFAALLVRVRLSRTDADLEAAGRVLDEFRRRPGDHDWEGTALRQHEAALDDGTDMPRLVFNLP